MCYIRLVNQARSFVPANNARPPSSPSNPPFRRQSSSLVVPPNRYVAPTYLLCFSLLRKHPGCGGILPILEPPAVHHRNSSRINTYGNAASVHSKQLKPP